MKSLYLRHLACLSLFSCLATIIHSQTIYSANDGDWNNPQTWSGGVIPTPFNSTAVTIAHWVTIGSGSSIQHSNLIVNGTFQILSGSQFSLSGTMELQVTGALSVSGTLALLNGASISGTSSTNTFFTYGSLFHFQNQTIADLPYASWDENSTILIDKLVGNNSVTLTSWTQSFGNVIYDCPAQGSFMDFNGRLRNVKGDLIIRNTNRNIMRMARGHILNLVVGGNLVIEGPSEVWFGETGENIQVKVGKSFIFRSSSTASSYLTLSGSIQLEIAGDFEMNGAYKLKCTSSSGKWAEIRVGGDFNFYGGTIDALGTGRASIIFDGTGTQFFRRSSGTLFDGYFNYIIEPDSQLDLGQSCLSNTTSGTMTLKGKMFLGSTHPDGVIQNVPSGNLCLAGGYRFEVGSSIELNADEPQYLGSLPDDSEALIINSNSSEVFCLQNTEVASLLLQEGSFNYGTYNLSVRGDLRMAPDAELTGTGIVEFSGSGHQIVDGQNNTINNVRVTGPDHVVQLVSQLRLLGKLRLEAAQAELASNGFLILGSVSVNDVDNGSIAFLSPQQKISGDVTIERYMPEGRVYRYISSPVSNASVQSFKNSFPVTGSFEDPSVGQGINSASPSFFYYDEPAASWRAYPVAGFASENEVVPGKGYAAFIRDAGNPLTWSVTGAINRDEISFDVSFTDSTSGWNLVGNPYPSSIFWDAPGWTKNNISNTIAIRDNSTGNFRYWNGSIGDLTDGRIAIGQAFWVYAYDYAPELVISESAKSEGPATFYRKEAASYLKIELTNGELSDVTYLQVEKRASAAIDSWDFPKMQNDRLNLSIRNHGRHLAVSAINEPGCSFYIPLHIASVSPLNKSLITLTGVNLFENATYRLLNTRTGGYAPQEGRTAFSVFVSETDTDDWVLEVELHAPEEPKIAFPDFICAGSSGLITVTNPASGVRFQLVHVINDSLNVFIEEGVQFRIAYDSLLKSGSYFIEASNSCGASKKLFHLTGKYVEAPIVPDVSRCGMGSVSLNATGALERHTYLWYETRSSESVIWRGADFTSPGLEKSKQYFVSIYDAQSDCESARTPVTAHIEWPPKLKLHLKNDSLYAEADPGEFRWFFNNDELAGGGTSLFPAKMGKYKVTLQKNGCVATDSVLIFAKNSFDPQAYPNPTRDFVFLEAPEKSDVILVDIINNYGNSVFYLCTLDCGESFCALDVRSLKNGMYLLLFKSGKHLKPIRLSVLK